MFGSGSIPNSNLLGADGEPGSRSEVARSKRLTWASLAPHASLHDGTRPWQGYARGLLCLTLSTALAALVEPYARLSDLAMITLIGIVLTALRCDSRVSLCTAALGALSFDFFFNPPRFHFAWTDYAEIPTFAVMLVVAGIVSSLNQRLRTQERMARQSARRNEALYTLSVELSLASEPRQQAAIAARHLAGVFAAPVVVLLRAQDGTLEGWPAAADESDREHAELSLLRGESLVQTGPGYTVWEPLVGIRSPFGVIGLKASAAFKPGSETSLLLRACANQLATTVERLELARSAHRSQLEAETERMRNSLLSAVSHDLKTPLAAMVAAGTILLEHHHDFDRHESKELLGTIVGEGERLTRLIQNLLFVSRLESPNIEVQRGPESIEEIVAAVLERLEQRLGAGRVRVDLPANLPWIAADPVLLEQVFVNLLENALAYAPQASPIYVSARASADVLVVSVADEGPGVPESERDKVFEKFYRARHGPRRDGGVGLGLTICRAIVRAHGGHIGIGERPSGGTSVEFTIPISPEPSAPHEGERRDDANRNHSRHRG